MGSRALTSGCVSVSPASRCSSGSASSAARSAALDPHILAPHVVGSVTLSAIKRLTVPVAVVTANTRNLANVQSELRWQSGFSNAKSVSCNGRVLQCCVCGGQGKVWCNALGLWVGVSNPWKGRDDGEGEGKMGKGGFAGKVLDAQGSGCQWVEG